MSKKIATSNRINIGFALLVVFLLVLATNRIDKRHFETVQNTLSTVYKDRVVAQDYVYQMNNIMYKKRLQLIDSSAVNNHDNLNKEFTTLIDVFATTELTRNELKTFNTLKHNFESLKTSESNANPKKRVENIEAIKTDLDNLALIQVSESKARIGVAQKSLDTNNLMSTLEIIFLILIGIIVQFAFFYRVKKSNPVSSNTTD